MWSGPHGVVALAIILVGVAGLGYLVMRTSGDDAATSPAR